LPKLKNIIQLSVFADEVIIQGESISETYQRTRIRKLNSFMANELLKNQIVKKQLKEQFKQALSKFHIESSEVSYEQFVKDWERSFDSDKKERAKNEALRRGLKADTRGSRIEEYIAEVEHEKRRYEKMSEDPALAIKIYHESVKKSKTACKALSENDFVKDALGKHGEQIFRKQINNLDQIPLTGFVGEIEKALQARMKQKVA
jgi:hypothetical protein